MESFRYRSRYPIEDETLTTGQVRRQAEIAFADDALARGIRLTGDVTTRIDGAVVECTAPAEPAPGRTVRPADRYGLSVAEMAAAGLSDRAIGEQLRIGFRTVFNIREALGIPSGRAQRKAA